MRKHLADALYYAIVTTTCAFLIFSLDTQPQWWVRWSSSASRASSATTPLVMVAPMPPLSKGPLEEMPDPAYTSPYMKAPVSANSHYKLSVTWLHRVSTSPYSAWYAPEPKNAVPSSRTTEYNRETDTWEVLTETQPIVWLTAEEVRAGRVLMPLHALYLRVCVWMLEQWKALRWSRPDSYDENHVPLYAPNVSSIFLVTMMVVYFVGMPLLWRFMEHVAQLLVAARRDRHAAALLQRDWERKYKSSSESPRSGRRSEAPALRTYTPTETEHEVCRVAFVGCVVFHFAALLPSMVLEVTTLYPVTYSTLLMLLVLFCLTRDERCVYPPGLPSIKEFDTSKPMQVKDGKYFFPKRQHRGFYTLQCCASTAMTVALLLIPSYTYILVPVLVWLGTMCFQKAYRPVAVCTATKKEMTVIGYSNYMDKNQLHQVLSLTVLPVILIPMVLVAFFSVDVQGSGFRFMDTIQVLVGGVEAPSEKQDTALASPFYAQSLTGGKEAHNATCLATLPDMVHCVRSVPNVWLIAESLGVPVTESFESFAGRIQPGPKQHKLAYVSFHFVTQVSLILFVLVGLTCLLAYRLRRPPDFFETAVKQVQAKTSHIESCREHWKKTALGKKRAGGSNEAAQRNVDAAKAAAASSAGSKGDSTSANNNNNNKTATRKGNTTVSLITREEYLVKQLLVLTQWLLLSGCVALLVTVRPDAMLLTTLLPLLGVLLALHAMMVVSRCSSEVPVADVEHEEAEQPTAHTSGGAAGESSLAVDEAIDNALAPLEAAVLGMPLPISQWCSSIRLHDITDGVWYACAVCGVWLAMGPLLSQDLLDMSYAMATLFVALFGGWWLWEWVRTRCWAHSCLAAFWIFLPLELVMVWYTIRIVLLSVGSKGTDESLAGNETHPLANTRMEAMTRVTEMLWAEWEMWSRSVREELATVFQPSVWVSTHGPQESSFLSREMRNAVKGFALLLGAFLHLTYRLTVLGIEAEEIHLVMP